ncbi:hypothetical protein L6R50_13865 [Myxococcota bacterium]|nr:hypothetical protein [Myxococcota bacterium]
MPVEDVARLLSDPATRAAVAVAAALAAGLMWAALRRRRRGAATVAAQARRAVRLQRRGDLLGAGWVHERAGRLRDAAELYQRAGDPVLAAVTFARAGLPARAAALLLSEGYGAHAGELWSGAGMHAEASRAFRMAGYAGRAAAEALRAGSPADAAALHESLGDWLPAFRAWRAAGRGPQASRVAALAWDAGERWMAGEEGAVELLAAERFAAALEVLRAGGRLPEALRLCAAHGQWVHAARGIRDDPPGAFAAVPGLIAAGFGDGSLWARAFDTAGAAPQAEALRRAHRVVPTPVPEALRPSSPRSPAVPPPPRGAGIRDDGAIPFESTAPSLVTSPGSPARRPPPRASLQGDGGAAEATVPLPRDAPAPVAARDDPGADAIRALFAGVDSAAEAADDLHGVAAFSSEFPARPDPGSLGPMEEDPPEGQGGGDRGGGS